MSDAENDLKLSQQERPVLESSSGDILLSYQALPYPGAILRGFRKQRNNLDFAPEYEPYVDFGEIKELLEFLWDYPDDKRAEFSPKTTRLMVDEIYL